MAEAATESTDPVFAFGARLRQGHFTNADFSAPFLNNPGPTSDYMSTAFWTGRCLIPAAHPTRSGERKQP